MTAHLLVETASGPLEDVAAELLIALFFEDERPLRGPAGRVDWRLCGLVSRRVAEERLAGRRDEALLVPCAGPLGASCALLVGLGARAGFGADGLADAVASAVRRADALRVARVALALPSEAQSGLGPARAAVAAVAGAAEARARAREPFHLVLWAPASAASAAARGAREAVESGSLSAVARLVAAPSQGPRRPGPHGDARGRGGAGEAGAASPRVAGAPNPPPPGPSAGP